MKSSTFGRAFELVKLASKVGAKELTSGDLKSRYEQAVLIVKSLSHLKGAAMKAGQLLSLDLDQYFPPEAIEILSQLQNAAVAQPFHEIKKIIDLEINETQRIKIESMDEKPIGVASIGQVHRARYCHKDIVLKVQYSNIANSIDSDLKILKVLASSFCKLSGRKMDLDPLFQEFKFILEQEINYCAEAELQTEFQHNISKINNLNSNFLYKVPQIIPELCSKKIIAMSFEHGHTLRHWTNTLPSDESKEIIAKGILDLYFHEFFEWGLVQTDPNWANFLVHENEDRLSLCLLDFGATRRYSRKFIQDYTTLLNLVAQGESNKLKKHAIELGFIDPRESESAFEALESLLKVAIRPFFINQFGSKFFDFSDENHAIQSNNAGKILSRELVYSPPPYSIVFLHRKLAGVYSILKSLKVKLDVSLYWEMMMELSNSKC